MIYDDDDDDDLCLFMVTDEFDGIFTSSGEYSEREGYNGSDYTPAYEDKDGDWMLVGDVPWEMFISSCKRLRIMKASE